MADHELQVSEKKEVATEQGELTREGTYFLPAVDILETEKELIVMADIPGVDSKDVEIDLKDDTLSIVGRVVGEEPSDAAYLLTEYPIGNYFRSFKITDVVDQPKIKASIADGVLKLVLPKAAKAIPRKIPVTTE
ncbi:MAG: Hsp20/alpha crystallin family protein [Thermodesulfobacteriota bacterium]